MSKVSELTPPKLKGARHQKELLLISLLAAKPDRKHPSQETQTQLEIYLLKSKQLDLPAKADQIPKVHK